MTSAQRAPQPIISQTMAWARASGVTASSWATSAPVRVTGLRRGWVMAGTWAVGSEVMSPVASIQRVKVRTLDKYSRRVAGARWPIDSSHRSMARGPKALSGRRPKLRSREARV